MQVLTALSRCAAFALLLLSMAVAVHAQPPGPEQARAPTGEGLAHHLLNRLGYGPAPGEVARLRALGAHAWVEHQLAPPPLPRRLAGRLDALSGPGVAAGEAALLRAIASPRQLEEVLVRFWLAHFRQGEGAAAALRPVVLGRYADLRTALAGHGQPAPPPGGEAAARRALLRQFVSAPSLALRRAVAREWERTRGDQRAVLRVLLTSPEFLAPAQWNSKAKDDYRFVVSAVRASGLAVENVAPLLAFVRGPLSRRERERFVERLAAGEMALAMAPVRPHEYASSAPPMRAGVDGAAAQSMVSQPGPVMMAAPTPSAAAMAAASGRPAQPGRLLELLRSEEFRRY